MTACAVPPSMKSDDVSDAAEAFEADGL